jgi:hypothetical protein
MIYKILKAVAECNEVLSNNKLHQYRIIGHVQGNVSISITVSVPYLKYVQSPTSSLLHFDALKGIPLLSMHKTQLPSQYLM